MAMRSSEIAPRPPAWPTQITSAGLCSHQPQEFRDGVLEHGGQLRRHHEVAGYALAAQRLHRQPAGVERQAALPGIAKGVEAGQQDAGE
jgi:hypothetical protein